MLWDVPRIKYLCINCSLYIECVDGAGVLEWNTANDTFVHLHTTLPGVVTGAPADDIIFVGNKEGSNATMVKPEGQTPHLALLRMTQLLTEGGESPPLYATAVVEECSIGIIVLFYD